MKSRAIRFLTFALAALSSSTVGAAEVSGWLGGSGTRYDAWSPPHDSSERLQLNAGLSAAGFLFSPEDIDWRGGVQYGKNRANYTGSSANDSLLTFDATAGAFDNRRSAFALRLGGSRAQTEGSTSSGGAVLTGTSLTTALSADARAGGGSYPGVSLNASWMDSVNSGLDRPDLRRTTKELGASAGHGGEGYTYNLSYKGRVEEGSLPALDYQTQTMGFGGRAQVTDRSELALFGQHFTRSPRSSDGTNPTYDDTVLSGSFGTSFTNFRIATRYDFGHFLFESSATPSTERAHHTLTVTGDTALSPEWSIAPSVGASYAQDRLGTDETTAAGQSIGTALRWNRKIARGSLFIEGNGRVGLLEPATGGTQVGWGGGASGRYGGTSGVTQYGASYRIEYDNQMDALAGWTLVQGVSGDVSRPLTRAVSFTSSLSLGASRSYSPLIGDGASRTANLSAGLQWATYSVALAGGLADGVAGSLSSPVRGDALFVPPSFQAHSRNVALNAAATFGRAWGLTGSIRYASTDGPDIPTQEEWVYYARVGYRIGQFTLSLDDTYRVAGTSDAKNKLNQVMVTFARYFSL